MHSLSKIVVESNALELVKALFSFSSLSYIVDLIVNDCKSLLTEINECGVHFVRRSVNSVAYMLARAAASLFGFKEWVSSPPPFICNALTFDSC